MEPNLIHLLSKWLADLNSENFKDAIGNVEEKLAIVHQTLSLLETLLENKNFDPILDEMFRSLSLKTRELLMADRATLWLIDRDRDEFWSLISRESRDTPIEIRIPVGAGIVGQAATSKQVVNIPDCYNDPRTTALKEFDRKNNYRTYHLLAFPLLNARDELIGIVQLVNKLKSPHDIDAPLAEKIARDGFSDRDLRRLEDFALSLRSILESARFFYKLRAAGQKSDAV